MTSGVPEFRRVLVRLGDVLDGDLGKLVSALGRLDVADAMRLITDAYPQVVTPYIAAAGDLTATWYEDLPTKRGAEAFIAKPADLPPVEQLAANGRYALTTKKPTSVLQGAGRKAIFTAHRDTVISNARRERVAWVREARPGACGFCRMLATRVLADGLGSPGLYRSEQTASRSPHTFDEAVGHDHCRCVAVPLRSGKPYTVPGYVHDWLEDYEAVSRDADGRLYSATKIAARMEARAAERDATRAASKARRPEKPDVVVDLDRPDTAPGAGKPPSGPPPPHPPRAAAPGDDGGRALSREQYRALDPSSRTVDTHHAVPMRDALDALLDEYDDAPMHQLARDLTGIYGPYRVEFEATASQTTGVRGIELNGRVLRGEGQPIGVVTRTFRRDDTDNKMVVQNDYLALDEDAQRKGFAGAFYDELEAYYRRSGVDRIEIHAALDRGGYAWARRGFDWNMSAVHLQASMRDIRWQIDGLLELGSTSEADKAMLRAIRINMDTDRIALAPSPGELAELSTADDPELGVKLMTGSDWYGVMPLTEGLDHG
jgi:GNAT superfamily N-acetyltransferase